jgi:beta-mannanase
MTYDLTVKRPVLLQVLAVIAASLAFFVVTGASAEARSPVALGFNAATITVHPAGTIERFESEAGARPSIAMYYQDWDPNWSTALVDPKTVDPIYAHGAVPMISWTPFRTTHDLRDQPAYRLRRIVAGAFDPYIRRAAREAAALEKPLLVNLAPEMNGSWFSYGAGVAGNTPREFKEMWRHVVRIFRRAGADDVRWVWSPNIYGNNTVHPFAPFYPGEDWVDVVGLDGYNWGHSRKTAWQSFGELFDSNYTAMTSMTAKPMIISETASAERGGSKARWIHDMRQTIERRMPRIRAVVWFDRFKERNWAINSSPRALLAFREMVSSPLFGGTAQPLYSH